MTWFQRFMLRELLLPDSRRIYERSAMKRPVPDLFHYTSTDGLMGILGSRSLWLTDFRSLNDTTEFTYAVGLILETLEAAVSSAREEHREWLASNADLVRVAAQLAQIYVGSFCERGDALSQWHAYAPKGYCIRFYGRTLEKFPDGQVVKVVYDPTQQRAIVRKTLSLHLVRYEEARARADTSLIEAIGYSLFVQLVLYAVCFKHPAFEDEREWRVVTGGRPDAVSVRESNGIVKPYVALSFKTGWREPFVKVCHAPGMNTVKAREQLEMLLERYGYSRDLAESSSVPLREWAGA